MRRELQLNSLSLLCESAVESLTIMKILIKFESSAVWRYFVVGIEYVIEK